MKFTTILVDDERDNNVLLEHFLIDYCPEIEIIEKCETLNDAFLKIKANTPNIVFLDINLGNGEDSFQLLEMLPEIQSKVIFVTAYPEFGHKAFRYSAIDYLVKPIKLKELIEAVSKITKSELKIQNEKNVSLRPNIINFEIEFKTKEGSCFSKETEILFIEALGRISIVHFVDREEVLEVSEQLGQIENKLSQPPFIRVHKAFIVNLSQVHSVLTRGEFTLQLHRDFSVPVSRRNKVHVKQLLNMD